MRQFAVCKPFKLYYFKFALFHNHKFKSLCMNAQFIILVYISMLLFHTFKALFWSLFIAYFLSYGMPNIHYALLIFFHSLLVYFSSFLGYIIFVYFVLFCSIKKVAQKDEVATYTYTYRDGVSGHVRRVSNLYQCKRNGTSSILRTGLYLVIT